MSSLISTHVQDAQARLLSQYQKPRIQGLVAALVTPIQELENALYGVPAATFLATATGYTLDLLGDIVGLKRAGLDDPTYRTLLYGTIGVNNSDGTMALLLTIVATVYQASAVFQYQPNCIGQARGPDHAVVGFGLRSPQAPSNVLPIALNIVRSALSGGIGLAFITTFDAPAFSTDGPQSWVAGFSDANDATFKGGGFAALLYQNVAI